MSAALLLGNFTLFITHLGMKSPGAIFHAHAEDSFIENTARNAYFASETRRNAASAKEQRGMSNAPFRGGENSSFLLRRCHVAPCRGSQETHFENFFTVTFFAVFKMCQHRLNAVEEPSIGPKSINLRQMVKIKVNDLCLLNEWFK